MNQSLSETQQHNFCLKLIEAKNEIELRFLEMGKCLKEIYENRYYEAGWTCWDEYIMDLKISNGTALRLINIYKVFILRYNFTPAQLAKAGWTAIAELLPQIKENTPQSEAKDWVEQSIVLSRKDLRRAIFERKTGIDTATCLHEDTYTIKICRKCGERWRI